MHIDPGKPWQNGVAESFIGKLRDECLNLLAAGERTVLFHGFIDVFNGSGMFFRSERNQIKAAQNTLTSTSKQCIVIEK